LFIGEAQKRFEEYQLEFKWRQAKTFFNDNKNSEWFKEKYHPTYLEKSKSKNRFVYEKPVSFVVTSPHQIVEKAALCKQNVVQFLEDYNSGNFHPSLSAEDINVVETTPTALTQPKKEEEKTEEKKDESEAPAPREEEEEEEEEDDSEDAHHRKVIKETPTDNQAAASEANVVQRTVFVKTIPPHWGI